ncbi:MAG: MATE family efflux transporter [Lachnospiraceae bacterium]|nr:MATE family efflux transporter [Lachnospiraceae bacterium]
MKMNVNSEKYRRITEDSLYPLLWSLAVPSMIGMMVSSVYSMTDTFFISKLDRTDLTASVGVVFAFISVVQAIGFWFGYGTGNHVSKYIGMGLAEEADRMTSVGVFLALAFGCAAMIPGLIFVRQLAVLLGAGAGEGLMSATVAYLRITLLSVPIMLAANVLYNVLRLQGSAKDSMTGLLAGMLINMALDPVFILAFHMGVAGAALASLVGQTCGAAILLGRMGKAGNTAVVISLMRPRPDLIKDILCGGAPNFCRQGISSISSVLLNNIAGGFGEETIAGMTVAMRIISIGYALVIGFGQGFQPICAINFGAGKYGRIKTSFRHALVTSTVFLCVSSAVIFAFANDLAGVFSSEGAVAAVVADILRSQAVSLPFMAYYILIGMQLQNIGRFGAATAVTVAQNGTFMIPAALLLSYFFGYRGLVCLRPVSDICALVFSMIIGGRIVNSVVTKRRTENE